MQDHKHVCVRAGAPDIARDAADDVLDLQLDGTADRQPALQLAVLVAHAEPAAARDHGLKAAPRVGDRQVVQKPHWPVSRVVVPYGNALDGAHVHVLDAELVPQTPGATAAQRRAAALAPRHCRAVSGGWSGPLEVVRAVAQKVDSAAAPLPVQLHVHVGIRAGP